MSQEKVSEQVIFKLSRESANFIVKNAEIEALKEEVAQLAPQKSLKDAIQRQSGLISELVRLLNLSCIC